MLQPTDHDFRNFIGWLMVKVDNEPARVLGNIDLQCLNGKMFYVFQPLHSSVLWRRELKHINRTIYTDRLDWLIEQAAYASYVESYTVCP